MATKKLTYKGSTCKWDCSGHKAGENYFNKGGRSLTRSSASFNKGMRLAQTSAKTKGVRSRLSVTKRSK